MALNTIVPRPQAKRKRKTPPPPFRCTGLLVDLSNDGIRALQRRPSAVHRRAEGTEPVPVRRRHLKDGNDTIDDSSQSPQSHHRRHNHATLVTITPPASPRSQAQWLIQMVDSHGGFNNSFARQFALRYQVLTSLCLHVWLLF